MNRAKNKPLLALQPLLLLLLLMEITPFAAALAAAASPNTCTAAAAPAATLPRGARVMLVDAASYDFKQPTLSLSACCATCAATDFCTHWAYCTAAAGCGGNSSASNKNNSSRDAPPSCASWLARHTRPNDQEQALPLDQGVGSFFAGCTPKTGRWRGGTCALYSTVLPLAATERPPLPTAAGEQGWTVGAAPAATPNNDNLLCPSSTGLSAESCATCRRSADPARCVACVVRARLLGVARSCSSCVTDVADDAALQEACVTCVVSPKPFKTGCKSCLGAGNVDGTRPANKTLVRRCLRCVLDAPPPVRDTAACSACYGAGLSYKSLDVVRTCEACVTAPLGGDGNVALAARCGCAACLTFDHSTGDDARACHACLASSARDAAGATACAACYDGPRSALPAPDVCRKCVARVAAPTSSAAAPFCVLSARAEYARRYADEYAACLARGRDGNGARRCMLCYNRAGAAARACLVATTPIKGG